MTGRRIIGSPFVMLFFDENASGFRRASRIFHFHFDSQGFSVRGKPPTAFCSNRGFAAVRRVQDGFFSHIKTIPVICPLHGSFRFFRAASPTRRCKIGFFAVQDVSVFANAFLTLSDFGLSRPQPLSHWAGEFLPRFLFQ